MMTELELAETKARDAMWIGKEWQGHMAYAIDPTKKGVPDSHSKAIADRRALLAEVKHLQERLQLKIELVAELADSLEQTSKEREGLRANYARLLATAKPGGSDVCATCAAHVLVITEDLEPEIKRLREALRRIGFDVPSEIDLIDITESIWMARIARAALEGK